MGNWLGYKFKFIFYFDNTIIFYIDENDSAFKKPLFSDNEDNDEEENDDDTTEQWRTERFKREAYLTQVLLFISIFVFNTPIICSLN